MYKPSMKPNVLMLADCFEAQTNPSVEVPIPQNGQMNI
jgi:hypothetical protein